MNSRVLVPVLLDLTGLRVLFVGAGEGTRTKLTSLVEAAPQVRIVAPEISPEVRALASGLDVEWRERAFEPADLEDVSLVFGMTSDPAVNAELASLCRAKGIWSNVAQNRAGGSFTSPAVARANNVIAAFSSATGQPALAAAARDAWVGKR